MNLDELNKKILEWAKDKDLLKPENKDRQFLKVAEEFGEIAAGMAEDDMSLVEDGIGDLFITLVILANQCGMTLEGCVELAYEIIAEK